MDAKYETLIYKMENGVEVFIYVQGRKAWLEIIQISRLFGVSKEYIKKIIDELLESNDYKDECREYTDYLKTKIYSLKIVEQIGNVLKNRKGNNLSVFVKENTSPKIGENVGQTVLEIIGGIFEIISNL